MSNEVRLVESTHKYFHKSGRELISVTKALELAGAIDFSKVPIEILERAAYIGDCIHEIAKLYTNKQLDISSVDDSLIGYLNAIQLFLKENVKKVMIVEKIVYDLKRGYAGTVDLVYQDFQNRIWIGDYKHGEALKGYRLQLGLYQLALERMLKIKVDGRATIIVEANGTYEVIPHRERQDLHDALTCLSWVFVKLRHKIK